MTSCFFTLKCLFRAAGIAQLVEHNLAKVGVASSSLVSRSNYTKPRILGAFLYPRRFLIAGVLQRRARWQSGHAAACKAVDAGSIPTLASKFYCCWCGGMVYTQDLKSCAVSPACGFESHHQHHIPPFPVHWIRRYRKGDRAVNGLQSSAVRLKAPDRFGQGKPTRGVSKLRRNSVAM